jgi:phosphotriesterase-related protein
VSSPGATAPDLDAAVQTVLGPVPADRLGHVQTHEHLLCDLRRYVTEPDDTPLALGNLYAARVDREHSHDLLLDDVDDALAELREFVQEGGTTLVEATPVGLGRDPLRLRDIAARSGVNIVMGCGYYVHAFHPPGLADRSPQEIADEIVAELTTGVDGTGVRAGVIGEIGMSWPTQGAENAVLAAAAEAQAETGVALLIHPGRDREAPFDHVASAVAAGADPERIVMCHVDRTLFTHEDMLRLAASGCVLEFDLFGTESSYYPQDPGVDLPNDGARVQAIRNLIAAGHRDQIVIAQDICRKTQLLRYGGEGYGHILRRVLPLMAARGLSPDDILQITQHTPRRLLTPG